jgi:dsDNA-binding SOS-regulon protein
MDPISALGVAGTVVQFAQFAASLVSNIREIHHSASGTTLATQDMEAIHSVLSQFSKDLRDSPPTPSIYGKEMEVLTKRCSDDCDRMLKLADQLKVESGEKKRWRKSFQKAILELWTQNDVEDLRQRINDSQASIMLVMCASSRYEIVFCLFEAVFRIQGF